MFSSTILLLAFIFLSVDGRSTSPWNRRRPNFTARTPSTSNALDRLMLPQIRGGDSDSTPSSGFSSALPTPISPRIGDSDETSGEGGNGHEAKTPTYNIHPSITGGHILRAGKVDPEDRLKNPPSLAKKNTPNNATSTEVVVDTYVTKKDKATKKLLKRHKQIAKKLKVRSHNIIMTALTLRFKGTKGYIDLRHSLRPNTLYRILFIKTQIAFCHLIALFVPYQYYLCLLYHKLIFMQTCKLKNINARL